MYMELERQVIQGVYSKSFDNETNFVDTLHALHSDLKGWQNLLGEFWILG